MAYNNTVNQWIDSNYKLLINVNRFLSPNLKTIEELNCIEWVNMLNNLYHKGQEFHKVKRKELINASFILPEYYYFNELASYNKSFNFDLLLNDTTNFKHFIKDPVFLEFFNHLIFETTLQESLQTLISYLLSEYKQESSYSFLIKTVYSLDYFLDWIEKEEDKNQEYKKELKRIKKKKQEDFAELNNLKIKSSLDSKVKKLASKLTKKIKVTNKQTYNMLVDENDLDL